MEITIISRNFFCFAKNLDLMKCVQCIIEVRLKKLLLVAKQKKLLKILIMSILQKYQDNLQNKMKGSDFTFNGINYLYYDLNRITISKSGSYIESPKWLKEKKMYNKPKKY